MAASGQRAIFIIGIEHRSGTNFLSDLLALHADCCRPATIGEDFLLHHAHHLKKYSAALHQSWNPIWRPSATQEQIGAALGRGLLDVLADQACRPAERLVTKTPRADRLGLFPWLFPDQPLLILIRDGRSVVESAVRSFGWSYGKAIQRWASGARRILEFDRDHRGGPCRYLVVRYEDLVTDLSAQIHHILAFLRLSPARYDFAAAANMPVRGSSMLKSHGSDLHWKPVPKPSGFSPLDRAKDWTARQNRRFLAKAGCYQELLGYSLDNLRPTSLVGRLYQRLIDARAQRKLSRTGLRPLAPSAPLSAASDEADILPLRRAA
jgi:hypothetical protein